jgi:hypothetical protein
MITINHEEFEKARKELEGISEKAESALSIVTARLINNAAKEAKKEAVGKITEEYYIDKKPVREAVTITSAKPNKLEAEVKNARKKNKDRFTLARFKVEVPEHGPIKVAQSKSGGLKELKRAFLTDRKNQPGNTQVFRRMGARRNPIDVERSYSIGGMIGAASLGEGIEETAQNYVDEKFPDMVDEYFKKRGE